MPHACTEAQLPERGGEGARAVKVLGGVVVSAMIRALLKLPIIAGHGGPDNPTLPKNLIAPACFSRIVRVPFVRGGGSSC